MPSRPPPWSIPGPIFPPVRFESPPSAVDLYTSKRVLSPTNMNVSQRSSWQSSTTSPSPTSYDVPALPDAYRRWCTMTRDGSPDYEPWAAGTSWRLENGLRSQFESEGRRHSNKTQLLLPLLPAHRLQEGRACTNPDFLRPVRLGVRHYSMQPPPPQIHRLANEAHQTSKTASRP